jgi:altronate hydrolase
MNPLMNAIQLRPEDHVAVAIEALTAGTAVQLQNRDITLLDDIPRGHKFAVSDIPADHEVLKFGESIGFSTTPIATGSHVHVHNLETALEGHLDYPYSPASAPTTDPASSPGHFLGYRREDGRVGTRNEIWILVTVGCVNRLSQRLAFSVDPGDRSGIDGVYAFPHPHGCSQTGGDMVKTRKLITALCCHPNAGGVLLLSLGCETNQARAIMQDIPETRRHRVRVLNSQQSADEFAEGQALLQELIAQASGDRRSECTLADLSIGMKCGGSDGFSGLTANPLCGSISDLLAGNGGQALLTEVPEMFGAEHLLMKRAASGEVHDEIVRLVTDFKDYFIRNGEAISDNPSPGNMQGGITTLEEKSLGAIQKGGLSPVTQVCRYGEAATARGLVLLEAPGNDAVSSTALTAAGANLVLFTTGRGTPLSPPVPTLKIASNSALAGRKPNWIDFDAGRMLTGKSRDDLRGELLKVILDTASGKYKTAAERSDQREIAIWKTGVTL